MCRESRKQGKATTIVSWVSLHSEGCSWLKNEIEKLLMKVFIFLNKFCGKCPVNTSVQWFIQ